MDVSKFKNSILAKIQELEVNMGPLILAATSTVSEMGQRIFIEGKNTSGGSIGEYKPRGNGSPKEGGFWVEIATLPKKPPQKRKKTTDGKRVYYPAYITLREDMGRQTAYVDLKFSGRLAMNFLGSAVGPKQRDVDNQVGPTLRAVKVKKLSQPVTVGVTLTEENYQKAVDMTAKYGDVFKVSEQEREIFQKVIKFETLRALTK